MIDAERSRGKSMDGTALKEVSSAKRCEGDRREAELWTLLLDLIALKGRSSAKRFGSHLHWFDVLSRGPLPELCLFICCVKIIVIAVLIDRAWRELSNGCHIVHFDYFDGAVGYIICGCYLALPHIIGGEWSLLNGTVPSVAEASWLTIPLSSILLHCTGEWRVRPERDELNDAAVNQSLIRWSMRSFFTEASDITTIINPSWILPDLCPVSSASAKRLGS